MGCEELTELILESTDSLYRAARGILKNCSDFVLYRRIFRCGNRKDYGSARGDGKKLAVPSGITVKLHFAFSGENAQEQLDQYHLLYTIADDCGNQIDSRYDIGQNLESETEQDGDVYSKDIYLELQGLDSECSSLTFTPYYTETDEEGKSVPDTGVSREDAAFTVHVTE